MMYPQLGIHSSSSYRYHGRKFFLNYPLQWRLPHLLQIPMSLHSFKVSFPGAVKQSKNCYCSHYIGQELLLFLSLDVHYSLFSGNFDHIWFCINWFHFLLTTSISTTLKCHSFSTQQETRKKKEKEKKNKKKKKKEKRRIFLSNLL